MNGPQAACRNCWDDIRLGAGAESAPAQLGRRPELRGFVPSQHPGVGPSAFRRLSRRTVAQWFLPIGRELAAELLSLRTADTAEFQFVFKGLVPKVNTLRCDLNLAGIVFVNDTGQRLDLYALRKTFGTALVLTGATPRVVMEAMRHSDLKLTMKTYTDAKQLTGPVGAAVKLLSWNKQCTAREDLGVEVTA